MFWHAIGATLILIGLQSWRSVQRRLAMPLFQWLGDISFPLYLLHLPILMSVGCWTFLAGEAIGAPRMISIVVAFLTFGSVAVGCADAFTRLIERRALRWSGNLARRIRWPVQPPPIAPEAV